MKHNTTQVPGFYVPSLKTLDKRREWFAKLIFKYPYRVLYDDRKAFIDYVAGQYDNFRKAITAHCRDRFDIKRMKSTEYRWIYHWFTLRLPPDWVTEALDEGWKYCVENNYPINSIGLFKNQVAAKWGQFLKQRRHHLSQYNYGEGYDDSKDRWFFNLFKKLQLKYDEHYSYDFYWGYRERERDYDTKQRSSAEVKRAYPPDMLANRIRTMKERCRENNLPVPPYEELIRRITGQEATESMVAAVRDYEKRLK